MPALELPAQPLRFDKAQLFWPMALLPGLAMAVVHAPVALLTFGPLVLASWLLAQRERSLLDRCEVVLDPPALLLCHRGREIDGMDLRFAERFSIRGAELVLSEDRAAFIALGSDPPDTVSLLEPPIESPGTWRAVRLAPEDLRRLLSGVDEITREPAPGLLGDADLLHLVGCAGVWGRRAEVRLLERLRRMPAMERPSEILSALRDLALRQDRSGRAARRILVKTGHV